MKKLNIAPTNPTSMKLLELGELKKAREKVGITQSELAKRAGVSQSLIARIEAGNVDPRYSTLKKIVTVLEDIKEKQKVRAKNIMSKDLIFVESGDSVETAVKKMEKDGFSQLPVLEKGIAVGTITESCIMEKIGAEKDFEKLSGLLVGKVMEEPLPTVNKNTELDVIKHILGYYPGVLVVEKGKVIGIITKADIVKLVRG
jgi:predicted transcriptional regulator